MKPAVEIFPAKDGEGFCLQFGKTVQWFAHEAHAISFAQETYPEVDVVLYGPEGGIRRRYSPGRTGGAGRTDSAVMKTPPPERCEDTPRAEGSL